MTMVEPKPLILFIDAFDSFSNNIIALVEDTLDVSVRKVKIDHPALLVSDVALCAELRNYSAVICGPGPGNPENERDVGIMRKIWRLQQEDMLPVLGICLGFQSLCLEFGGNVKQLKGPQHGIVRRVTHFGETGDQKTIFTGVGEIHATLYQSLCVDLGHDVLSQRKWEQEKWNQTTICPDILPLAWVEHSFAGKNDSGIEDERVLVAVQHKTKPFWALQYHPESICTNDESRRVLLNWFIQASSWNKNIRRSKITLADSMHGDSATRESLLSQSEKMGFKAGLLKRRRASRDSENVCHTRVIKLPIGLSVPEIVEKVQDMQTDQIILESSNAHDNSAAKGRYSIIGLDIGSSTRIEYTSRNSQIKLLTLRAGKNPEIQLHNARLFGGIWHYLSRELENKKVVEGVTESPFWGGFMGYTTYELGLETIKVEPKNRHKKGHARPDLCLAWITRSMVIDHAQNLIYIQHLAPRRDEKCAGMWIDGIVKKLEPQAFLLNLKQQKPMEPHSEVCYSTHFVERPSGYSVRSILRPNDSDYESKVLACQSHIRAGSSYELCLTDQTTVSLQTPMSSWPVYKALRRRQPAPFAAYIRLGSATFVSASPERFLKWCEDGSCELRPMKGTVRKSPDVQSLAHANSLLNVPKERAENLMIVDLVRHDLHEVCGSGNVSVPKLMVVEEYASVFQMSSIVTGRIPPASTEDMIRYVNREEKAKIIRQRYTGLDVLAASLPPGSMTGAPKKRSCEILQEIEDKERSLYSGVVGYLDARGRGDWSVNIRCLFKWDDECILSEAGEKGKGDEFCVGAGGAVTALSTARGEREEMHTKLIGTLGIFG